MNSGKKDTYSPIIVLCLLVVACGSAKAHEYIIDVPASMLRGPAAKDDLPLSFCTKEICYAFKDQEVKEIKKYIAQLELRLKQCKGKE